jgi:hypothetical protein
MCAVTFGLSRSARHTHISVDAMLLQPLRRAQMSYVVYMHTWLSEATRYTNHVNGELEVPLDRFDFLRFPANIVHAEPEDVNADRSAYLVHGDPWAAYGSQANRSLLNCVSMLESSERATHLWRNRDCGAVIYTRPDITFINSLNVSWLHCLRTDSGRNAILMPNHARWPVNDRFAIGRGHVMRAYGTRFRHAGAYASVRPLGAEEFLDFFIKQHDWDVKTIRMDFHRTRVDGRLEPESFSELADL